MPPSVSGNRTGAQLEQSVEELIRGAAYERVPAAQLFFALRDLGQAIYAPQCETEPDIYGHIRRVDFLLYHPEKWPSSLAIQCKWQASKGTVDQKYPFEVLSIAQGGIPTMIVLDGGGYSEGAEDWLRDQVGRENLVGVFSLGEFQRFVSGGNL